jgi:hypothetical protein
MNRLNAAVGIALALTWTGAALAQHEHGQHGQAEKPQQAEPKESKLPLCPLMGEPVDFTVKTMTDEGPVYFCCKDCIPKYEKDPAKYRAKLEASYTYQTKCPVSGDKIDPTAFTDLPTRQRIYLCCAGCGEKLLNDPAKYAPKLAEQGVNVDVKKLKGEKPKHDEHGGHEHDHP